MADKKISQLPATASVNSDDTFEKSLHNAAPSERVTAAQLATFMQTAMALVQLSGGNIKLNADGSASFAGVKILFNADGSCTFASANAGFAADGALNLPLSHLLADGSAQFANGALNITANGEIHGGDATRNGLVVLQDTFASANISLDASSGATFFASFFAPTGNLSIGGGPSITLVAADGSVSFANGQATLDAAGNLGIAGTQVVTAQQPAIADATNAVDVITQFNTLLAALRIHGLIAP